MSFSEGRKQLIEYVNGELAAIIYNFDVRKEYSDFVNEFFNKLDDELFKDLI